MPKVIYCFLIFICFSLRSQVNLVPNPSFEFTTGCPSNGAEWNLCSSWDNVNLNTGSGWWGTPDFFHTCGTNGTAPPATFAGTCSPHTGSGMMALVVYDSPYPDYREYIATPLTTSMQPGTTYTLSFWLSNGTGVLSPYSIANIGVCFSSGALTQSAYGVISATPQCEITSNVASTNWTNYTFTVNPTASWDHLTIGAFRPDASNNVTMSFTNPGGPASAYANYFVDDVKVLAPSCNFSVTASAPSRCAFGPSTILTASGGTSYTWSPTGSLSSSTGSVVSASPTVNTVYTVTGLSGTCISTQTIALTINHYSFIGVTTSSVIALCPGATGFVGAQGAVSYTWMPGGSNSPTINVTTSVNTIYTVTGTDIYGCIDSRTVPIVQIPGPVLGSSLASLTMCAGSTASFIPNGGNSYTVQPGNSFFGNGVTVYTSASVSTVYTLTGSGAYGCTASIVIPVTVIQFPTLTIVPSTQTVCAGSPANFSVSGAASYTWYPSLSNSSVLTIPSVSATTIYTVIGSSGPGCGSASTTAILYVNPVPTLIAVTNPSSTCAGGTVTLTASGGASYTWLPGNITGSLIIVNPLTTTVYSVTGYLNSCSSLVTVVVSNPLSPTITSSGNIDCNNSSSQIYIASNSSTYSILWSGPGVTGLTSSVITVTTAGTYSVTLTNTVSNCSAINTITVLNNTGPLPIVIIPSTTLTCYPGPPVSLLTSSSANYTWFPSTLTTPSVGPLVSVSPSVTTTYTVMASQGTCTGSAVVTISVNPTPTISLPAKTLTVCSKQPITLFANGALNYNWAPGSIPGSSIIVRPSSTTVFTVTGNTYNCYASEIITVIALTSPTILANAIPSVICVGDPSTLTASGADSISWHVGLSTITSSSVTVNPFTTTQFTVTGTNSLGCTSSQTVVVAVSAGSALTANASSSLICQNETVSLTVSGAVSYTWLPVNQTGNVITLSPSVSTTYTVIAENSGCRSFTTIVVQVQQCIKPVFGVTDNADVTKDNEDFYRIKFTVTAVNSSPQEFTNLMLNDDLKATFIYPCTFTIIEAPKVTSSGSSLLVNPLYDGVSDLNLTTTSSSTLSAGRRDTLVFTVQLDPHGFSGFLKNSVVGFAKLLGGQTVSDSSNNGFAWDPDGDGDPTNNNEATPIEIELSELFIPEGFSPNSDGIHDVFFIKGLNGRQVNVTVFNRWGNKVYEKENYDNSWDGRANVSSPSFGKGHLPEGTYYYILQFQSGKEELKTGFVVLRYE